MKKGIVIVTTNTENEAYKDCLKSFQNEDYPIFTHVNDQNNSGFELAGLEAGFDTYDLEEVFLVQETIQCKDTSILKEIMEHEDSVFINSVGHSYFAKYKRTLAKQLGIPKISTKEQAIQHENQWNQKYKSRFPVHIMFHHFKDGPKREHKYGRINMVIENEYFIKYKGKWC